MTEDQIKKVEMYAGYFFAPDEIVLIIGLDNKCQTKESFKNAYKKGKLIMEAAVRKSILDLAVSGSSPAQVLAVKFMDQSKLDEE